VTEAEPADSRAYGKLLGAKLRAIRQQQKLSLNAVQELSSGRWKAVVVGSYERGDRALTVARLAELAAFYDVPVSEIVPAATVRSVRSYQSSSAGIVLDLQGLRAMSVERAGPLARFAKAIQDQRGDYNNRMLSVQREDLRSLAIIYDRSLDQLLTLLSEWGVLLGDTSPAKPSYMPADLTD
jgi:transcriptional regulator with XRE-family HTH domain